MKNRQVAISPFAGRIYWLLQRIPPGRVVTYKELARAAGIRSSQAVGQALRKNPYAPEVPCHRVISSNLTIGGYGGDTEGKKVKRKLELLASEGVMFAEGKLQDPERLWSFAVCQDEGVGLIESGDQRSNVDTDIVPSQHQATSRSANILANSKKRK